MARKPTTKKSPFINNSALSTINEGLGFQAGYNTSNLVSGTCLLNFVRSYPMSNNWQLLSDLYFTEGVIQAYIDVPVNDAFRGGIKINSGNLNPDDIQELLNYVNDRQIMTTVQDVAKWCRLYGGGGIVIETDGDPATYLNINKEINKNSTLNFYAADLWELNMINTKEFAFEVPYLDEYDLKTPYNFYGNPLNKSRVLKMLGKIAPSRKRPILRGWGMSAIDSVIAPLTQFAQTQQALLEMINEAKISVFSIPDMANLILSEDGISQLLKTIQDLNLLKSYHNALVIPAESKFEQKELNFAWLNSALDAIYTYLCAAMRIPKNKLLGDSATGFASGQDSLENYNMMLEGIRGEYTRPIKVMLELACKKLFGYIPTDLQIEFPSLRVMTDEEAEIVKNHKTERILKMYDRGIITAPEVLKQANLHNLVPTEVAETPLEDFPVVPEGVHITDYNK